MQHCVCQNRRGSSWCWHTAAPYLVRMRNLLASLMTGYKLNRRHWRSRTVYSRKVSNELHGDPGRSRREIINRLAGLKASKECGVFRRTRSQEESLKMPFHLQMLGRCDIIRAKGKPVPVVHRLLPL